MSTIHAAELAATIPATRMAACIRSLGGPEVIEYGELPMPAPGPTDVLVRVIATPVDIVDTFVRSGRYAAPTPFPFIIGRDLIGQVVAPGRSAFGPAPHTTTPGAMRPFEIGDVVWTNSLGHGGRQGAASEYALVPADRCFRLPEGVEATGAAAALHGWSTAYLGIEREAAVRAGETVVVAGAAGAVGSGAVAFAARAGARVIATASAADRDVVLDRGADLVLDHHSPDLFERLAAAAPDGIDVFWDTSGLQPLTRAIPLLAHGARIVATAGLAGDTPVPMGALYTRDASIRGFAISNASAADAAQAARGVNRLLADGVPTPEVADVLPLSAAREAHARIEAGGVRGRIVLVPSGAESHPTAGGAAR